MKKSAENKQLRFDLLTLNKHQKISQAFSTFVDPFDEQMLRGKKFIHQGRIIIFTRLSFFIVIQKDQQTRYVMERPYNFDQQVIINKEEYQKVDQIKDKFRSINNFIGYKYRRNHSLSYGKFKNFLKNGLMKEIVFERIKKDNNENIKSYPQEMYELLVEQTDFKLQKNIYCLVYCEGSYMKNIKNSPIEQTSCKYYLKKEQEVEFILTFHCKYSDNQFHGAASYQINHQECHHLHYKNGIIVNLHEESKITQVMLENDLEDFKQYFGCSLKRPYLQSLNSGQQISQSTIDYFLKRVNFCYYSKIWFQKSRQNFIVKIFDVKSGDRIKELINQKPLKPAFPLLFQSDIKDLLENHRQFFSEPKFLIFPIHSKGHFYLIAFEIEVTYIHIYLLDSLNTTITQQQSIIKSFKSHFEQIFRNQNNSQLLQQHLLESRFYNLNKMEQWPKQENSFDCGLFVCLYSFLLLCEKRKMISNYDSILRNSGGRICENLRKYIQKSYRSRNEVLDLSSFEE